MTEEQFIKEAVEEILKITCIEAQNNKFVTPIIFRQSIKLMELIDRVQKEAIEFGRASKGEEIEV